MAYKHVAKPLVAYLVFRSYIYHNIVWTGQDIQT